MEREVLKEGYAPICVLRSDPGNVTDGTGPEPSLAHRGALSSSVSRPVVNRAHGNYVLIRPPRRFCSFVVHSHVAVLHSLSKYEYCQMNFMSQTRRFLYVQNGLWWYIKIWWIYVGR